MTPNEIKGLRQTLGLTLDEWHQGLAMAKRTAIYWESGEPGRDPKGPALILLRMLQDKPALWAQVSRIAAEIETERAKGHIL